MSLTRAGLNKLWWYRLCKVIYFAYLAMFVVWVVVIPLVLAFGEVGSDQRALYAVFGGIFAGGLLLFWLIQWAFHYIVIGKSTQRETSD